MVGQKVVVCDRLWQRLKASTEVFRTLYGFVKGQGELHINGTTLQLQALPYGQPALGIYCSKIIVTESILAQCQKRIDAIREALDILDTSHFILLINEGDQPSARLVDKQSLTETEVSILYSDFSDLNGVLLRTRLSIPLTVEYCGAEGQFRDSLIQAVESNCSWLTPNSVAFELNGAFTNLSECLSLGEFARKALQRKNEPEGMEIQELCPVQIIGVDDDPASKDSYHSPVIHIQRGNSKVFNFFMILDVAAYFSHEAELRQVNNLLAKALQQQVSTSIETTCSSIFENQLTPPSPMHFRVDNGFATILYPRNVVEKSIKEATQIDLAVKSEKPIFSSGQAIFFAQDTPLYSNVLLNPHIKLNPPPRMNRIATVRGNYLYFHYMQQKFDDVGWGCAYRSLQTLCSWFRLQGYTEEDIPNHKKIQEVLVEIGDKESNFIGSKQWIGSQEVSYVLSQLMNIDSKTIFVSSGGELPSKASDLISHFETCGTPVMIGGGQLAHTIIGIAVNDLTEETHFLILDPHYTGAEDLQTINGKGWCNWKPSSFWNQASFYNMCLPQITQQVES